MECRLLDQFVIVYLRQLLVILSLDGFISRLRHLFVDGRFDIMSGTDAR